MSRKLVTGEISKRAPPISEQKKKNICHISMTDCIPRVAVTRSNICYTNSLRCRQTRMSLKTRGRGNKSVYL